MRTFKTCIFTGLIILSFFSCGRKFGIERFDRPNNSLAVGIDKNGTALIRSLYCDISLQQIQDWQWEKILSSKSLINPKIRKKIYRVPKVLFFETTIKNTWKYPVEIEKITIDYGKTSKKSLTHSDMAMQYKSPLYKLFNFEEIFKTRRVIAKKKPLDTMNFSTETIPYRISFIPPGDLALKIFALEKPESRERNYRITFHLKLLKEKKVIAFNIMRFEYRTRGKNFIKTRKKNHEN